MKDGGQAFPPNHTGLPGMSLRDYFAGQYLAGATAYPLTFQPAEYCASEAYKYADAMLLQREKGTRA